MADEPILGLFDSDTNLLDELTGGGGDLGAVMSSDGESILGQSSVSTLESNIQFGSNIGHSLSTASVSPTGSTPSRMVVSQLVLSETGYQQIADGKGFYSVASTPGSASLTDQFGAGLLHGQFAQFQTLPKLGTLHHGDGVIGNMGLHVPSGLVAMQQPQAFRTPIPGSALSQQTYHFGISNPQVSISVIPQQQNVIGQQHGMLGQSQGVVRPPRNMVPQQQGIMMQQPGLLAQQQGMVIQHGVNWQPQQISPIGTNPQFPDGSAIGIQPHCMVQSTVGQPDYCMGQYNPEGTFIIQQANAAGGINGMPMIGGHLQRLSRPLFQTANAPCGLGTSQQYAMDYIDQRQVLHQQHYPYQQNEISGMQANVFHDPSAQTSLYPQCPVSQTIAYSQESQDGSYPQISMSQINHFPQMSGAQNIPFLSNSASRINSFQNTVLHNSSFVDGSGSAENMENYAPVNNVSFSAVFSNGNSVAPQVSSVQYSLCSSNSYGQSSLQELQLLVSPMSSDGQISSSNPYQLCSATNQPLFHSSLYSTAVVAVSTVQMAQRQTAQSVASYSDTGNPLRPSSAFSQSGVAAEIQQLEKQIQHLFTIPQTQHISQQILDFQERLRMLKARQQQNVMQMQRQSQSQLSVNSPTHLDGKNAVFSQIQHIVQRRLPASMNAMSSHGQSSMGQMISGVNQGIGLFSTERPSLGGQAGMPPMMGQFGAPTLLPRANVAIVGTTNQFSQMQALHILSQPVSHSPSLSIVSPHKGQLFQNSTSGQLDGLLAQQPTSQPLIVQQAAADSMTDPVQMTPPAIHPMPNRLPFSVVCDSVPATVTEIAEAQEGQGEKPKRKRARKQKDDQAPKDPKEKKVRLPKKMKEPRPPRPPKESKPKKNREPRPKIPKMVKEKKPKVQMTKAENGSMMESHISDANVSGSDVSFVHVDVDLTSGDLEPSMETDIDIADSSDITVPTTDCTAVTVSECEIIKFEQFTPKKKLSREKKTRLTRLKPLKRLSTKKRKPPASLFLQKLRRKKAGSDGSDADAVITPPSSPLTEGEYSKRRSARNTKRKKYLDDVDLNLSEEDSHLLPLDSFDGTVAMKVETEEDSLVIEKILGDRLRRLDSEELEDGADEDEDEEEFYLKYKNYSYLHCDWRTLGEIADKRILFKIKRYKLKKMQSLFDEPEDGEYFNPEYVEVDRVIDCITNVDESSGEEVSHFLVKWRSLSYEESTWELQQDVDPNKVRSFLELRKAPSVEDRRVLARPRPSQWSKQEEQRVYKGDNMLREYQLEGVNWLTFCWHNVQNCILADEMGLGKTIQSIAFLNEMFEYGIKGPFLIIVPLSTVCNWQREFETWTDLNTVVYHGTSNSRSMIQEYEMYYKDEHGHRLQNVHKFHVLITTYEIIIADVELLTAIDWRCCIIDEAHRLKNRNCRLLEGLRLFEIEYSVLLTGTPLQNNTDELFSLLNFLNPVKFSSSAAFAKDFGDLKTEEQVDALKEILKPMMLRRLKEDVEKNLAPKEETIIEVELTNIQKKYYRAILERNFQFLAKGGTGNVPSLMNAMMELRKCCNHPYLINGAEEQIVAEQGARGIHSQALSALISSSGKMVLMDKLLPRLKQDGHKVLIFSQMIRVLDIIEDYLIQNKYLFERLDGRIRGNLRQEAIDRFSKTDSDRFVFLLCTRAGGLGINLTAADTVVIYDSDWNPQNDLQAQARCHRIGQSKSVKVYRLITRNSYEREMFDKASLKLGLDKAVLQSLGDKAINPASQMSKKEVEDLLKKGAYGALMEDEDAGDKFCEEDIDLIMQRRTKVIQIESEGKGSTFAKASFSVSENRTDIDINDPNFWQKWAKKADIDVDSINSKNELIIKEPRQRRQTSRYGKEEAITEISDLDSSTDSEDEMKLLKKGRKLRRSTREFDTDFSYIEGVSSVSYVRSDCFKVEKYLLVFGWDRWHAIREHAHFKHILTDIDVMMIARAILAYSLKFYRGDELIKEFIWDLIANKREGGLKNHMGLSAPVPRGRKGKKAKEKRALLEVGRPLDFDPEIVLDEGYKRHLHRHNNKVLLRVRLLYYIKQELIGDAYNKILDGAKCNEVNIPLIYTDVTMPSPSIWWDGCADRCLLIGTFKHGYEKYNQMRQDSAFCFLERCGPPDGAALLAEQLADTDDKDEEELEDCLSKEYDEVESSHDTAVQTVPASVAMAGHESTVTFDREEPGEDKLPFPGCSDLTIRLRRVVTSFQRCHKRMLMKQEQFAKRMERREQAQMVVSERTRNRKEFQQSHWSRREEADFYRTVSTFGVEFDRETGRFKWDRFRLLARLDRKHDDMVTEYFHAFYYMCQSVCGKFRSEDRVPPPPNGIMVDPITEERASRCLGRIDLLNKIRDDILPHPKLDVCLKLCQPSFDMPCWWICGRHDMDLLIGAARHGLAHTDYHILRDPTLSFMDVLKTVDRNRHSLSQCFPTPFGTNLPNFGSIDSGCGVREQEEDDVESDSKSQGSADGSTGSAKAQRAEHRRPLPSRCLLSSQDRLPDTESTGLTDQAASSRHRQGVVAEGASPVGADSSCVAGHVTELYGGEPVHGDLADCRAGLSALDSSDNGTDTAESDDDVDDDGTDAGVSVAENMTLGIVQRDSSKDSYPLRTPSDECIGEPNSPLMCSVPRGVGDGHMCAQSGARVDMKGRYQGMSNLAGSSSSQDDGAESGARTKPEEANDVRRLAKTMLVKSRDTCRGATDACRLDSAVGAGRTVCESACESGEPKCLEEDETQLAARTDYSIHTCGEMVRTDSDKRHGEAVDGEPGVLDTEPDGDAIDEESAKTQTFPESCHEPSSRKSGSRTVKIGGQNDGSADADKLTLNEAEKGFERMVFGSAAGCRELDGLSWMKNTSEQTVQRLSLKPEPSEYPSNVAEAGGYSESKISAHQCSMDDEKNSMADVGESGTVKQEAAGVVNDCVEDELGHSDMAEVGEKPDFVKLKERIMQLTEVGHSMNENGEGGSTSRVPLDNLLSGKSFTPVGAGAAISPITESEFMEPGEIALGRPVMGSSVEWPKDRIIFHRLEHICYTVEHNEWPITNQRPLASYLQPPGLYDSGSATPVGSAPATPSESGEGGLEVKQVLADQKDFEVRMSQNEGLKMTFHKRGRGRGHGSVQSCYDMDADKAARVHQLLNHSAQMMASSDFCGIPSGHLPQPASGSATSYLTSSTASTPLAASYAADSLVNQSPMSDMDRLHRSLVEHGILPEKKRRGRKRKSEKMAEMAIAEALAKREQYRILSALEPDASVPVVNLVDGSILSGDDAPRKRHLEQWLLDHPGFMISPHAGIGAGTIQRSMPFPRVPPAQLLAMDSHQPPPPFTFSDLAVTPPLHALAERRRPGRKPRIDPRLLYGQPLTGDENVSVIERGSGRKITGAKAPPLKHLREWLDQNPSFDVDSKWGDLLRAQGSVPTSMDGRLLKHSGRGRKPRSVADHQAIASMMGGTAADFGVHAASVANMMAAGGYPQMPTGMPFNLATLGMNPMLGFAAAAAAGFPLPPFPMPPSAKHSAGNEMKDNCSTETGGASSQDKPGPSSEAHPVSQAVSGSPHPPFPNLLFNPLAAAVFNPLLASQMRNMPIPHFPGMPQMPPMPNDDDPVGPNVGTANDGAVGMAESGVSMDKLHTAFVTRSQPHTAMISEASFATGHDRSCRESAVDTSDSASDLSMRGLFGDSSCLASTVHRSAGGQLEISGQSSVSVQEHATDLSMKVPSDTTAATDLSLKRRDEAQLTSGVACSTPSPKSKNKIHKSFSLNRIVDSLKEKMEEKTQKVEFDHHVEDDDCQPAPVTMMASDSSSPPSHLPTCEGNVEEEQ